MMNNGFICESANIDTLDTTTCRSSGNAVDDVKLRLRAVELVGFGGTNACVVLKRLDV